MPRTLNALDMLRRDHRHVEALLKRFNKATDDAEQRELCEQIVTELRTHAEIEEQVFYPWLREATARDDLFETASIEHETTKNLLEQLPREQPGTARYQAMVRVLGEYVVHHVQVEETEIFPQVERTGVDLEALGEVLQECREGRPPMAMAEAPKGKKAKAQGGAAKAADGGSRSAEAGKARKARGNGQAKPADGEALAPAPTAKEDEAFVHAHEEGLSRSTVNAKWIHEPGDRPEHDGQTLATRNLEVIRAWAEARGGRPATTAGGDPERPRVLRFDFPDYDKGLQEISWEAWGRTFQERDLVFLFQETLKSGRQSNFFRLDSPEREDA